MSSRRTVVGVSGSDGGAMHLVNGKYQCRACGAVLDIPHDKPTKFSVETWGTPAIRMLMSDGKEIHRCVIAGSGKLADRESSENPVRTAAPALSLDVALPRALTSPTVARHLTTSFLDANDNDTVAADAGLVVGELVSNAVMHATGPIRLAVSVEGMLPVEAMLRIEVFDGDDRVERVVLRQVDTGTLGGRGLRIVNTLAESWGTLRHDDGKTVWAELLLPGRGIEIAASTHLPVTARRALPRAPHLSA
jgi:anti-sigma regulatory factor (Ser/Thr protein kinase)